MLSSLPMELIEYIVAILGESHIGWPLGNVCRQVRQATQSPRLIDLWKGHFFSHPEFMYASLPDAFQRYVLRDLERAMPSFGPAIPMAMSIRSCEEAVSLGPLLPSSIAVETLVRASSSLLLKYRQYSWKQLSPDNWAEVHLRRFVKAVPRNNAELLHENFYLRLAQNKQAWRSSTAKAGLKWFDALRVPAGKGLPLESVGLSTSVWLDELNPAYIVSLFQSVRGLTFPSNTELLQGVSGVFVAQYELSKDWRLGICGFWSRNRAHPVNAKMDEHRQKLLPVLLAQDAQAGNVRVVGDVLLVASVNCVEHQLSATSWKAFKKVVQELGLLDTFDPKTCVFDIPQLYGSLSIDDVRKHPGLVQFGL